MKLMFLTKTKVNHLTSVTAAWTGVQSLQSLMTEQDKLQEGMGITQRTVENIPTMEM